MNKIAAALVVVLAFAGSYGVVKANYDKPMQLATNVKVSNVVVNKYSDGSVISRGSIVKIIDGCNVIYMSNAYVTRSNIIEVSDSPARPTQISVINGCK